MRPLDDGTDVVYWSVGQWSVFVMAMLQSDLG